MFQPTKAMKGTYTQATPAGATEFGATFRDASGAFAVTGGTCV